MCYNKCKGCVSHNTEALSHLKIKKKKKMLFSGEVEVDQRWCKPAAPDELKTCLKIQNNLKSGHTLSLKRQQDCLHYKGLESVLQTEQERKKLWTYRSHICILGTFLKAESRVNWIDMTKNSRATGKKKQYRNVNIAQELYVFNIDAPHKNNFYSIMTNCL